MKEQIVQCKETKNTYQFIFSDGVIVEKDKTNLPSIDKMKS